MEPMLSSAMLDNENGMMMPQTAATAARRYTHGGYAHQPATTAPMAPLRPSSAVNGAQRRPPPLCSLASALQGMGMGMMLGSGSFSSSACVGYGDTQQQQPQGLHGLSASTNAGRRPFTATYAGANSTVVCGPRQGAAGRTTTVARSATSSPLGPYPSTPTAVASVFSGIATPTSNTALSSGGPFGAVPLLRSGAFGRLAASSPALSAASSPTSGPLRRFHPSPSPTPSASSSFAGAPPLPHGHGHGQAMSGGPTRGSSALSSTASSSSFSFVPPSTASSSAASSVVGGSHRDTNAAAAAEVVLPVYSAFRVLDARGMSSDYYTNCLSYGVSTVATAVGQQVLLFNPSDLAAYGTVALPADFASAEAPASAAPLRVPSAVCMSYFSDACAFIGDTLGGVCVVRLEEGSTALSIVAHYDGRRGHPLPEWNDAIGDNDEEGERGLRSADEERKRSLLSPSPVHCIASSPHQPYVFYVGYGDGTVRIFDARRRGLLVRVAVLPVPAATVSAIGLLSSASSPCAGVGPLPLRAKPRVVSLDVNSTGGLIAVGTALGAVQVFPIAGGGDGLSGAPVREWLCGDWSAAKALAFHPTRPSELSVGGGIGDGILRTFDVRSGRLLSAVRTQTQITQLRYSGDGSHIVTAHGFAVKGRKVTAPAAFAAPDVRTDVALGQPPSPDFALASASGFARRSASAASHHPPGGSSTSSAHSNAFPSSFQDDLLDPLLLGGHHERSLSSVSSASAYSYADDGARSAAASPIDLTPFETVRGEAPLSSSTTAAAGHGHGHGHRRAAATVPPSRAGTPLTGGALGSLDGAHGDAVLHSSLHGCGVVTCHIPSNSIAVWSRVHNAAPNGTPSQSSGGYPNPSHAAQSARGPAAGPNGGGSAFGGDGVSPMTDAGRAALRRAHTAFLHSSNSGGGSSEDALDGFSYPSLGEALSGDAWGDHSHSLSPSFPNSLSWRRAACLTQHSSRPLFLTRCRAGGADGGVFASAAGGDDCSIRLWRFTAPAPNSGINAGITGGDNGGFVGTAAEGALAASSSSADEDVFAAHTAGGGARTRSVASSLRRSAAGTPLVPHSTAAATAAAAAERHVSPHDALGLSLGALSGRSASSVCPSSSFCGGGFYGGGEGAPLR